MPAWTIKGGPRRFNDIKRAIGTISQRMLTLTLRSMERDGIVKRTVYPTKQPRVDYELTALGHSLREPVEQLGLWAIEHGAAITRAQTRFDAKEPRGWSTQRSQTALACLPNMALSGRRQRRGKVAPASSIVRGLSRAESPAVRGTW
ncbi:winged helix-turn-helix transcriptional regulator [Ensifer sp. NPDC090286]|uniref:winged helix-turn-helix transcriptional regulator n=1 Tax=Ensifer sp. NPDC090286 TaxID=3363991 RepID=UPI00383AB8BF